MNINHSLILAWLLICSSPLFAQQHPLVGTWELVSAKGTDANGEAFSFNSSTNREVKIITPTHYMFIAHEVKGDSMLFTRSMAGTILIEGNTFNETPSLSSDVAGSKFTTDFTWSVNGDQFTQKGTINLPDGNKIILDELLFQRLASDHFYTENPSVGVWDQLSSSYTLADGSRDSHTNATATRFQIITPTHWMRMSHRDNKFESAMGGTYTMEKSSHKVDLETIAPGYGGTHKVEVTKIYPGLDFASFTINPDVRFEYIQSVESDTMYVTGFGQDIAGKKTLSFEDVFIRLDKHSDETASFK